MITNKPESNVADRDVTLTACSRVSASDTAPCGTVTGDVALAAAKVRFNSVDQTPFVVAWDERR